MLWPIIRTVLDGLTDGWMDGWMDGRTDGRMDGNCSFIPFQQSLIIMSRLKGDNEKLLNGAKVTKKGLHLYLEP